MTAAQRARLAADVDQVCARYEVGFDGFLDALSVHIEERATSERDELVADLLRSCAEGLSKASLDFYASTK